MQLNFYTFLAGLMQMLCMMHAFLNLLIDHRARRHFRHPWYFYTFFGSIVAMI